MVGSTLFLQLLLSIPTVMSKSTIDKTKSADQKQASQQKSSAFGAARKVVGTVVALGSSVSKQAIRLLGHLTNAAGQAINFVGNLPLLRNPVVRRVAGVLRLD
jgi:hypothetical protein